jgi:hypothetical protein
MERYDSANTAGLVYELDGSSPDYKEQLWQNKTHISLKLSQPTFDMGDTTKSKSQRAMSQEGIQRGIHRKSI